MMACTCQVIYLECLFGYSLDPNLPNQQTFYMEGECYDYDADIDELFVLAGKIICPAGQEEVCFTSIKASI